MFHFTVPTEGQQPSTLSASKDSTLFSAHDFNFPTVLDDSKSAGDSTAVTFASLGVDVPYLLAALRYFATQRPSVQCVQVYDFWD